MMLFFASSVCKSFRVISSVIYSGYRFILLLYHHHFGSNSQTVPRKYPHRIDLHWDDVFFEHDVKSLKITTSLFF